MFSPDSSSPPAMEPALDADTTRPGNVPPAAESINANVAEKKGIRFWLIILSLSVTAVLPALDGTIISTTLPAISVALGGGEEYVWVSGSYFLATTALQPLFGQLANFFGRRKLLVTSILVFMAGSGICGGASSMAMLIGGRAVQGVGGAGLTLLVELIICDIVPLRERGQYTSIIYSTSIVGSAMGPWIGGELVDKASWRWVFYINLPIGGAALAVVVLALQVNYRKLSLKEVLYRSDFVGNVLFIGATIGLMFGLIYGGIKYPWNSWHIVVALVLGAIGVFAFGAFEASPYCVEPAIPHQVFANRTSVAAILISLLHSSLLVWVTYFVSVYFEAVRGYSAAQTGVNLLANVFAFIFAAGLAGGLLTKFGRYRPWHLGGLAIMTIGIGLYSLIDQTTPTYGWVLLIIFFAMGCGFVMPSLVSALQADLSDLDSAAAMAAITIARNFGSVLGSLIPSIIFNNEFDRFADSIQDESVRVQFLGGKAYTLASGSLIRSLQGDTLTQVISAYIAALRYVWYAGIAVCLAAFVCVFLEKEIDLRTTLDSDFSMAQKIEGSVQNPVSGEISNTGKEDK